MQMKDIELENYGNEKYDTNGKLYTKIIQYK
jgi:hypothetical protein